MKRQALRRMKRARSLQRTRFLQNFNGPSMLLGEGTAKPMTSARLGSSYGSLHSHQELSASFFSTTTLGGSLQKDHLTMDQLWKKSTTTMLDPEVVPIGYLDSLQWQMVETMILRWADPSQQSRQGGVYKSLELLDRLNAEVAHKSEKKMEDSKFTIDIYILHAGMSIDPFCQITL